MVRQGFCQKNVLETIYEARFFESIHNQSLTIQSILSRTYFLNQSGILAYLISISLASVISAIHVDSSSELSKMKARFVSLIASSNKSSER